MAETRQSEPVWHSDPHHVIHTRGWECQDCTHLWGPSRAGWRDDARAVGTVTGASVLAAVAILIVTLALISLIA